MNIAETATTATNTATNATPSIVTTTTQLIKVNNFV